MTRIVLAIRLGQHDTHPIDVQEDERLVQIDFLDAAGVLGYGIGRVLRDLRTLNLRPTAIALDLLIVAVLMYIADIRVSRPQTSQDGWTREIRLVLPAQHSDTWNTCGALLAQTLRFLTGDLWELTFRQWPESVASPVLNQPSLGAASSYDGISLFSGGLDSLIGAIDTIEKGQKPLFASHAGDASVSSPQHELFASLATAYVGKASIQRVRMAMHIDKSLVPGIEGEDTTRGRSFLFFALGATAGSSLTTPFSVRVPENGFISLNVPLDGTRLGSNSTRTTHPYYIHRWNELLKALGIPGTISNPYWNKTKGEMIRDCANLAVLKKLAPMSVSCAHPSYKRYAKDGIDHCGSCMPCIIRRAAFTASPVADPTQYRLADLAGKPLDSTSSAGIQIRAIQHALLRLGANSELSKLWIHKPGPLMEDLDKLADLAAVYARGMTEVGKVVQNVQTISSKA